MAGCFGNHPVDRWMEQQLNQYLAEDNDYEEFLEELDFFIDDIPIEFIDSETIQNVISGLYTSNFSTIEVSDRIRELWQKRF